MKIRAKSAHYHNFFYRKWYFHKLFGDFRSKYITLLLSEPFSSIILNILPSKCSPKMYVWALLIVWISTIEVEIILFESMFQLPFINFLMRESQ